MSCQAFANPHTRILILGSAGELMLIVYPLEGGVFDNLWVSPRTAGIDDLGLEQSDHGLGHGVVVGIPDASATYSRFRRRV